LKAIVGLGNPGDRFKGTRHNIGFEVVDELVRRGSLSFELAPITSSALIARWRDPAEVLYGGGVVLVAKPLTFMNLSGQAVGELLRYFKIDVGDLLVIVDEVQLPLGKLRARARGSAGGHNGLKSIIAHLGDEFSRLRVGVGRGPTANGQAQRDLADHVLARFDPDERVEAQKMTIRAADAAETFITSGIAAVMNAFNGGDLAKTE
jgi:PTH1 family peptidyl-tRNA hydrolase